MSASEDNSIPERDSKKQHSAGYRHKPSEPLVISDGALFLIDQFMLANSQLTEKIDPNRSGLGPLLKNYGGCLLSLPNTDYQVFRNPRLSMIAIVPQDYVEDLEDEGESFDLNELAEETDQFEVKGSVFVDTRCLVLSDVSLLNDRQALEDFKSFRTSGNDKKARDFLRTNGAAVRYGFNRYGDELAVGVKEVDEYQIVVLWPDICDES